MTSPVQVQLVAVVVHPALAMIHVFNRIFNVDAAENLKIDNKTMMVWKEVAKLKNKAILEGYHLALKFSYFFGVAKNQ